MGYHFKRTMTEEEIVRAYDNFMNTKEIGAMAGITRQAVHLIVKRNGRSLATQQERRIQLIREMTAGGLSTKDIAHRLQLAPRTVREVCLSNGIELNRVRKLNQRQRTEIKTLYNSQKMNQIELAEYFNCSQSYISQVINDERM